MLTSSMAAVFAAVATEVPTTFDVEPQIRVECWATGSVGTAGSFSLGPSSLVDEPTGGWAVAPDPGQLISDGGRVIRGAARVLRTSEAVERSVRSRIESSFRQLKSRRL